MNTKFCTIYICCFKARNGYTSAPLAIFKNEEDAKEYTMNGNERALELEFYYYPEFLYYDYNWNPRKFEPTDEEIDKSVKEMYKGAFGE